MNLKFSIITVCHNAEDAILRTINSVKNQTYQNIEHIIIDGNSSDSTIKIITNNLNDSIKFFTEKDSGIYNAMNKGLYYATGDIVAFLNADDFYYNNDIVANVESHFIDNIKIVYGNIRYYNNDLKQPSKRTFIAGKYENNSYLRGWHAPHPAFFCKKNCFVKYGNFNEELDVSSDFELMFRFQEIHKQKSFYLNNILTYMGIGGASSKALNIIRGNINVIKAFKIHNKRVFVPIYLFRRLIPKILALFF